MEVNVEGYYRFVGGTILIVALMWKIFFVK